MTKIEYYVNPFRRLEKTTAVRVVLSSTILSIVLYFFILNMGSYFGPTIYPLLDRVTYSTPFVDKHFFSDYVDSLIIIICSAAWFTLVIRSKNPLKMWIPLYILVLTCIVLNLSTFITYLSLIIPPSIVSLIIFNRISKRNLLLIDEKLCINYISIMGIALALLSLAITIPLVFDPDLLFPPMNFFYYGYLLFTVLTPIMLFLIALAIPIKMAISKIFRPHIDPHQDQAKQFCISGPQPNLKDRVIYLLIIICISTSISLIPHLITINPDAQFIGDDTLDYIRFLNNTQSESTSIPEILYQVFHNQSSGDRAVSLLVFYSISNILNTNGYGTTLELLPLLLGPLLILSVYFLTVELTSSYRTALIAALFTIPFQVLIGIYAGLYANWFSLIFGYLAIYFLFKSLRKKSIRYIVIFSLLLVLVHFSHAPTWTIFCLVLLIFLTTLLFSHSKQRKLILFLFLALIPSIAIDTSKMILTNNSGVTENFTFANNQGLGVNDIYTIWHNLVDTTQIYMAGQIGNPIILSLVVYWIIYCSTRETGTIFFLIFSSLTLFPILFGETEILTRLIYEIPLQIPAAIGLSRIIRYNGNLLLLFICISLITVSVRTVMNFHFYPGQ
ncbi:hypothetical protein NMY3_02585 [Candidatus Nitrosocosmicus oleophilus]|uniref:Glycosyltransferase RgtA/B/C/D-like domain-containing protein n=1 Tax=Candidatus Nitrosocosmicus oleophilus TaxID=1353260 RepID=A0A654M2A7_9ARCH|nr:hypothetical protein [Candidatus Nitrosocosmicus oleophilus]ALI36776.1 hypothetical protein NMY3_02585 [Candidatus Nitrosocosmicus oleophilus]